MPSLAAPSPDPNNSNHFSDAIRDLVDIGCIINGDGGDDIAAPTQLFDNDCDDAGIVAAIRKKRRRSASSIGAGEERGLGAEDERGQALTCGLDRPRGRARPRPAPGTSAASAPGTRADERGLDRRPG